MTTKEKIVRKSIAYNEKRIKAIDEILDANPLGEICDIRIEAQALLEEWKASDPGKKRKEIDDKLCKLAKREKELFKLSKRQRRDTIKLSDERCKLSFELGDLHNELWHIERRK